MGPRTSLAFMILMAVLLSAGGAVAQIPAVLNYQVMLTDDADQPLADQSVTMVFSLYDAESGGSELWTETQTPTTNSIGVVSVILGSVTPVTFDFDQPLWLEVEVNGETLSPRRELTAAPYAGHAAGADDSERLGGTEAHEYVLADDLDGPGTVNDPSNPVDWNVLFDVPAGFADGVDNTGGAGDGHSLDASDGNPTDALYVDADGNVGIGTTSPQAELHVSEEMHIGSLAMPGSLKVHGGSEANGTIILKGDGPSGASIGIENGDGEPVGLLRPSFSAGGGGQFMVGRNEGGVLGFGVYGNYAGSQEPRVIVNGSQRWAVFNMGESGDDSVALPDSSISSTEVLDEPGVANIQSTTLLTPTQDVVLTIAARTIFAPSSGYVFATGSAQVEMRTSASGIPASFWLGVSDVQNAWSDKVQEYETELSNTLPAGTYHHHLTAQGLFEVSAGTHTFYMNAMRDYGVCYVTSRDLTLMYFPTAHGSVDLTD